VTKDLKVLFEDALEALMQIEKKQSYNEKAQAVVSSLKIELEQLPLTCEISDLEKVRTFVNGDKKHKVEIDVLAQVPNRLKPATKNAINGIKSVFKGYLKKRDTLAKIDEITAPIVDIYFKNDFKNDSQNKIFLCVMGGILFLKYLIKTGERKHFSEIFNKKNLEKLPEELRVPVLSGIDDIKKVVKPYMC